MKIFFVKEEIELIAERNKSEYHCNVMIYFG